ncbi:MAG: M15 family metallopeptidase, partial [Alcaligenaceae bacterium]|nr:M15 family metallopeptidase [Alcaligenaceae bacterium]
CSARPGHSEHQTGLAVDVMGSNEDRSRQGPQTPGQARQHNARSI